MFNVVIGVVGMAAFCTAVAGAQLIDLSATGNCDLGGERGVALTLTDGIYIMQPVQGAYAAWFRWPGGPVGCDGAGGNCDNGWTVYWDVRRGDGSVEHYPNAGVPNSDRWQTPELALAHSRPALLTTRSLETMAFFINDSPCSDNTGGVSLDVSPCVSITLRPTDQTTCGSSVAIFVVEASGIAPFAYQWQVEAAPGQWDELVDGFNSSNGEVSFQVLGAQERVMRIRSIWGLGGNLRCVISNGCGSVPTTSAPFTVLAPDDPICAGVTCDADVNSDGNADQGDIDYLINVIAGGDNPTLADPDFNHDGNADQGDVDSLINVVAGGDCP